MAIKKITFKMQAAHTFLPDPTDPQHRHTYGDLYMYEAEETLKYISSSAETASTICAFLAKHPAFDIRDAIEFFYKGTITVKEVTKKRRVYSIPCLWIHEED